MSARGTSTSAGQGGRRRRGSIWVVSVYSMTSDAVLAEQTAKGIKQSAVQRLWGLQPDEPPRPLLVGSEQIAFVNEHLENPVALRPNEEVYLEQYAE